MRKSDETPASTRGGQKLNTPEKIPQPWQGKNVSRGNVNMGQESNDAHNAAMNHAAQHATYRSHDSKANAPLPFNAHVVGAGPQQDQDEPTTGQETMPKPFNTGRSKTAGRGKNDKIPPSRDWKG